MKRRLSCFVVVLALAAAAPLLPISAAPATRDAQAFPGWPHEYEGVALQSMAPIAQDAFFTRDFPGRIARFAARDRQVVVRWVSSPTRRLHPASQCFVGAGFALSPLPMRRSADGALMSCFAARKPGEALRVCEQLRDSTGDTRPDVSSWYWHALVAPRGTTWWSYVVVEREATNAPGLTKP